MHKIISAEFLAPNIKRFIIEAPKIATGTGRKAAAAINEYLK